MKPTPGNGFSTFAAMRAPRLRAGWLACASAPLALLTALLILCLSGLAHAAPLVIPAVPPDRLGCGAGWQAAQRVAGFDGGVGYVIEAGYDAAGGAGRLLRRPLNSTADAVTVGAAAWEAGALLDSATPAPAARRIFTMTADGATVPVEWPRLDAGQRDALDPAGDGLGEARIAWLRGDRAREGAPFRRRTSLLGDIVRSTPLLVGAPGSNGASAGAAGFADFHRRYGARQKLLLVGARDAMLHAFSWEDGVERYAYVPRALMASVPAMTTAADGAAAGTAAAQPAGVDAAPGQGDAIIGGQWRTVLVSGMGMGARGLFALDVTDSDAAPVALWEFSERDDSAIGHVQAAPLIVKLAVNGARGAAAHRYFALVSNGVNAADGDANGALFLMALDKPPGTPWRHNQNYFRLRTAGAGTDGDAQAANLLAPPVVTIAADGSAGSAYAGDLRGVMWRFELDAVARPGGGAGRGEGAALFHARDAQGAAQPISEPARVVFAPGGGHVVLFGTGRAIEAADLEPVNFAQQTLYGVFDSGASPLVPVGGRRMLAQRRLVERGGEGFTVEGARFDYRGGGGTVRQGWYVDFSRSMAEGERSAGAPALSGTAVVLTTAALGHDRCNSLQRSYVLDSLTGFAYDRRGLPALGVLDGDSAAPRTGRSAVSADGLLPLLMTRAEGEQSVTPTGAARGLRAVSLYRLPPAGTGGAAALIDRLAVSRPTGRVSWREIANWRELHDAAATASSR